jgi:hypothetical protein
MEIAHLMLGNNQNISKINLMILMKFLLLVGSDYMFQIVVLVQDTLLLSFLILEKMKKGCLIWLSMEALLLL